MFAPRAYSISRKIPDGPRNHVLCIVAEFVGTFFFLFTAFLAAQAANTPAASVGNQDIPSGPSLSKVLYIAFAFGLSLLVNAWVFYRISGGQFNPAVSLGLLLVGAITPLRFFLNSLAQILGAIAASAAVSSILPGPLNVTTSLGNGVGTGKGFGIEVVLTFQLVFTIIMLAVVKHRATAVAPVGIGIALLIGHLAGIPWTGASMNPARSFGPAVVTGRFPSEHWIYWVGPGLGATVAAAFYRALKGLEYETANPGQDGSDDLEVGLKSGELGRTAGGPAKQG